MKDNRITCINSKGKPNDIFQKDWLKEGEKYTVVKVQNSLVSGIPFFVLEEIQPGAPYGGYAVNRFAIPTNTGIEVEEEVNELITV